MKKCIFCLILSVVFIVFAGCTRVAVSPADELMMTRRQAHTNSGMTASLEFFGTKGQMLIEFPDNTPSVCIRGSACADDKMFYITVEETGITYAFAYKMYGKKAQIKYAGNTLDFYPSEDKTNVAQ